MIAREAVRECRRQIGEIWHRIAVGVQLLRPGQHRFEQASIPQPGAAAVFGELAIVDRENERLFQPDDHRAASDRRELAQQRPTLAHSVEAARLREDGGTSRATSLPCDVTTTSSPVATVRRYSDRRLFNSRTEIVMVVGECDYSLYSGRGEGLQARRGECGFTQPAPRARSQGRSQETEIDAIEPMGCTMRAMYAAVKSRGLMAH